MSDDPFLWAGLALSFAAAFLLSLIRVSLDAFSKIGLSRLLENEKKTVRQQALDYYEENKAAAEYVRDVLLIAFLAGLFAVFPRLALWPLWLLLAAAAVYTVFLDWVPRVIAAAAGGVLVRAFLPSLGPIRALSAPLLLLSRRLLKREEREEAEADRETTDEEIETFLDSAQEEGIIDKGQDELLRSAVEFGDTLVHEIMTPRNTMVCIRRDATIDNLKDLIIREKYSRVPVFRDRLDNIEGVVMAKDLLEYSDEKHKRQPIEALVRPVGYVPETMEISDLLREFRKARQNMAIVVDEHGGVSGLVTMEDVLEELVGEIQDEYDTEEAAIFENGPLDYTVSGQAEVEEMEELFDVELAEDDFISVAGLVIHELGRLPRRGEVVRIKGLRLEVLDVDPKRIKKVRIRRDDAAAPGGQAGTGGDDGAEE